MSVRRVTGTVAALGLSLALAACSNGSTVAAKRPHTGVETASASANGVQVVTITTGNDLRFHPSEIIVHPGRVRIELDNTAKVGSGPPHNLVIPTLPGLGGVPYAQAGQTQEWTFTAPSPGRYQFVCQLHAGQGQTGTLVVKP